MYKFDNHKRLIEKLHCILEQAAEDYDHDSDVIEDFLAYMWDWVNRRAEDRLDQTQGI